MAALFTVDEAQTLVSDLIDQTFEVEGKNSTPVYEQFMNVDTLDRGEHTNFRVGGFSFFEEHFEGNDLEPDQLEMGEKQTIKPRNWGKLFEVSEYVIQDLADAGPDDGYNRGKLAALAEFTRRIKRAATWTVNRDCADLLLNGTSSAGRYAGRSSQALFTATHTDMLKNPPTTQSNLATGASMSQTQLENAIRAIDVQLDDTGNYIDDPDEGWIIVCSPQNMFRADEITRTRGQVDSANNNINTLDKFKFTVVVNKYLGSSNVAFYVLKKGVHKLNWLWRLKPQTKREGNFTAVSVMYRAVMRGVGFHTDWRGTYAYTA